MSSSYDIAVRIGMEYGALGAAVAVVQRLFQGLERNASTVERAVQSALGARTSAYTAAERAANTLSSAQVRAAQADAAYAKVMGSSNATIAQQIAAQDRLTIAHNSLANAQISQASASNQAANAMAHYNAATAEAERQARVQRGMGLLGTGAAVTAVGAGLFAFMDSAVKKAMDLQTVMLGIATATGQALNGAAMQALQGRFVSIGLTNQMSVTDVANVASAATQAGITNIGQLNMMLKPLANFAEVLKMRKGMNPAESASIATSFAHLMGANTPTQMSALVNTLGRALFVSPSSPAQFEHLISQFSGTMRPLYGTSPTDRLRFQSDAITTAMLESQLGQTTRGGTQVASMISRLFGGGARSQQQRNALSYIMANDAGKNGKTIDFFDAKTGKFKSMTDFLTALGNFARNVNNPEQVGKAFYQGLGAVGARQAGLLGDPATLQRWGYILQAMTQIPGMAAIQKNFNQTPQGQFNQARANFDTAMTLLGTEWLPIAADGAKALADFTKGLVLWIQHNPEMVKFIATCIAVAATIALIVGPFLMLMGIVAIIGAVGLPALAAAFLPVVAILAVLVLAVVAIAYVITHWKQIIQGVSDTFTALGSGLHDLLILLHLIPNDRPKLVPVPASALNPASPGVSPTTPDNGTNTIPGQVPIKLKHVPPKTGDNKLHPVKPITPPVPFHVHLHGTDHETSRSYVNAAVDEIERRQAISRADAFRHSGGTIGLDLGWTGE